MSEIYFISDTHFGHHNIIDFDKRPFDSVEEMNEQMIKKWNSNIKNQDTVYHLGDFSVGLNGKKQLELLTRLNGQIHFISGNHDLKMPRYVKDKFSSFSDGVKIIRINDESVFLSHYPVLCYTGHFKDNCYHFYGHVHNSKEEALTQMMRKLNNEFQNGYSKMLNVGCNMEWMEYEPKTYDYLKSKMIML